MVISTYQPYFAPFTGFFIKALRSDILVLLDSVQFPRGTTWLTRNRFKGDRGPLWMTIPVWKKGLGLQKISEVKICHEGRWSSKHLATLRTAYARSPYLEDHLIFLNKIFSTKDERLVDFNLRIINHLMKHLKICTKLVLLSDLRIEAKEPQLSVEICKKLKASHFLASNSARKFLEKHAFQKENIALTFFNPHSPIYPQLWGPFIPNLSAFDLIFNCGPKSNEILIKY